MPSNPRKRKQNSNNNQNKRTDVDSTDINYNLWKDMQFDVNDRRQHRSMVKLAASYDGAPSLEMRKWSHATGVKWNLLGDPALDWYKRYYKNNKDQLEELFENKDKFLTSSKGVKCHSRRVKKRLDRSVTIGKNPQKKKKMTIQLGKTRVHKDDNLLDPVQEFGENILFKNGHSFEHKINQELIRKNQCLDKSRSEKGLSNCVTIFTEDDYNIHKKSGNMKHMKKMGKLTLDAMNEGIPLIFQGVVVNDSNFTYGITDILVRSDVINKLMTDPVYDTELKVKAPNLKIRYHYRVIDIKWTTMELCVNGENIYNSAWFPAYKGQLAIYNAALGRLQGYTPNETYIMARAWHVNGKEEERGYSCFDRLGVIDYAGFDNKYIMKTKKAIQWVHKVSLIGGIWGYYSDKPDIKELYPNMCNSRNGRWGPLKSKIAKFYDEITGVWYLRVLHRDNAHEKGIMNTIDPRCTTKELGMKQGTRSKVIDSILATNRSTSIIEPSNMTDKGLLDLIQLSHGDYFVDFEVISGTFMTKPEDINIHNSKSNPDSTFMIGVGFKSDSQISTSKLLQKLNQTGGVFHRTDDDWEYVCFYETQLSDYQEKFVFVNFINFIKLRSHEIKHVYKKEATNNLIHWYDAEPRFMRTGRDRHYKKSDKSESGKLMVELFNYFDKNCRWCDLYKKFATLPITVNGAQNFKLKTVTNALYKHKMIKTIWPEDGVMGGFNAMIIAMDIYENVTGDNIIKNKQFMEVVDYNEVDCKAMFDIVKCLYTKYC